MKVSRTVLSGGKDGDDFKLLPIATQFDSGTIDLLTIKN
ncbi:hypothetical protein BAOM_p051 (plasmid) [Peribacillus asahii]|uniref:Uncharacterized protein n=1 Tax=Peribacillus asahii TaxID=228899 RepID=A0A3Q9RSJ7_9BACI|nr:hypothetical protein BAOM_p051 [Peribacillus asahii]